MTFNKVQRLEKKTGYFFGYAFPVALGLVCIQELLTLCLPAARSPGVQPLSSGNPSG